MTTRRQVSAGLVASAAIAAAPAGAAAQTLKPIALPVPRGDGGMSLTAALLSDLLWSAFGVNRPNGDRTALYWRHVMVLDVYVAMADGAWLSEPKNHRLVPYLNADIRAQTGLQDFVAKAPLNLIYVAHGERMTDISPEERRLRVSAGSPAARSALGV